MTPDLLPWYERIPLTLAPGHVLPDGNVLTFEASTACPCVDCRAAFRQMLGPGWHRRSERRTRAAS